MNWLKLACTLHEVSQAYQYWWFIQAHTGLGYLIYQIINILSLSSPFDVSTPSRLSSSGYTPNPALSQAPDDLLPQPNHPIKRAEKCP